MKKLIVLAAVAVALLVADSTAQAAGHANPFNVPGAGYPVAGLFKRKPLPAFQAAPWYTYWPYNSHFQMPAPLPGTDPAFGGGYGGFGGQGWMNPYFPQHGGYGK
jgi:hypothetical protein